MIKEYTKKDFVRCVEIINAVWDFDSKFSPSQLSRFFKNVYVKGNLSVSNYAIVFEKNNTVQGFLFGKVGNKNLKKDKYSGYSGQLKILYQLLFLNGISLRKRWYYLKIITEHERNRRLIEPFKKNEVNLFAVDPNAQGKGYGKILMNSFIKICRKHNVNRITLNTGKDCNYGFYDHFGFKKKGIFYSPLQKDYSGGKYSDCYVYEFSAVSQFNPTAKAVENQSVACSAV